MLSKQSVGRKRNYILCGHLIFERQKIRGKEQKLILHHLVTCPPNHEIVQICVTPIQRLLPIFPSSYLHFDTQIKCTPFFLMCYPFLFVLSFITWYDQPCQSIYFEHVLYFLVCRMLINSKLKVWLSKTSKKPSYIQYASRNRLPKMC